MPGRTSSSVFLHGAHEHEPCVVEFDRKVCTMPCKCFAEDANLQHSKITHVHELMVFVGGPLPADACCASRHPVRDRGSPDLTIQGMSLSKSLCSTYVVLTVELYKDHAIKQ